MERFPFHHDEPGKSRGSVQDAKRQTDTGRQMDSLQSQYPGNRSNGQHGPLRARHRRTEGLRLYLGGILRLVHRDGKTASVQRDRRDEGRCTVDLKNRSWQCIKAAASVYAVHHRGNLLHTESGRGFHHDRRMAERDRRLCIRRG